MVNVERETKRMTVENCQRKGIETCIHGRAMTQTSIDGLAGERAGTQITVADGRGCCRVYANPNVLCQS